MKQIIGYMEYDYIKIKYGMRFTVLLFILVSGVFALKSGLGAVGYMLFGAMMLTSMTFGPSGQTVSFGDLVPGTTMQKVLGKHLMELVVIALSVAISLIVVKVVEFAGFDNMGVDLQILTGIVGITLLLLALQNVLLYLLIPVLGWQFANIIRMIPGFILFFLVMNEKTVMSLARILAEMRFPGGIILGIGAAALATGMFLSYAIVRKREGR